MTVKELFKHFEFVPDRLVCYDKTEDEMIHYEKSLGYCIYIDFIESITNKEIESWRYSSDGSMLLVLGNEQKEAQDDDKGIV